MPTQEPGSTARSEIPQKRLLAATPNALVVGWQKGENTLVSFPQVQGLTLPLTAYTSLVFLSLQSLGLVWNGTHILHL